VEHNLRPDVLTAACGRSGSVVFTEVALHKYPVLRVEEMLIRTHRRFLLRGPSYSGLLYLFKSLSESTSEMGYDLSWREHSFKHYPTCHAQIFRGGPKRNTSTATCINCTTIIGGSVTYRLQCLHHDISGATIPIGVSGANRKYYTSHATYSHVSCIPLVLGRD
jgi:hypothetical protein